MQRHIVLAGERVALAQMTEADQPLFCEWLQNADLRSQIDDARIPGHEDQMAWFQRVQQPDRRFFSLVTVPDHTLIGNCGFVGIDTALKTATLRITIGNPVFQGKGFGSEAVRLMVRYAFSTAAWSRLTLSVLRMNTRAIRTYEKAGFTVLDEDLRGGKPVLTMVLDSHRV